MKIGIALGSITVAGLLAGCAIPASRTVVEPVSTTALGLAPDAAPMIAADWWRSFGDPQLDRLVHDAVAGERRPAGTQSRTDGRRRGGCDPVSR